jgi:hypothetical protein
MPRAYRHMTWRVVEPDREKTSSLDSELQSLVPNPEHITNFAWVTVARGNGDDLRAIAKALNQARYMLGARR